jgi:hypothetical protein
MPPSDGKDELKAVGTAGMLWYIKKIILGQNLVDHDLKILFVVMYTAAYNFKPMSSLKHFIL